MTLDEIEFRTLDCNNDADTRAYLRLFWDLPLEHNEYFTRRSETFLDDAVRSAQGIEKPTTTYAGIALHAVQIVGLHLLHRFEEYEQTGVHIAGLWVHPDYRGIGITRTLKRSGETWARSIGAMFTNTNVHVQNDRMRAINEQAGFSLFRYNMRERL